jgi:DHA2 family multidrug resistance protein
MSGIGMGASMVTLSTVSLSTIPRYAMTAASRLYTLTGREAGNVAYAALATLVARREQFHRSDLVDSISATNPAFRQADAEFRNALLGAGLFSAPRQRRDLAMVNALINRQSTMMAYNDCCWLVVPMFLVVLPLLFSYQKRGSLPAQSNKRRRIDLAAS